MIVERFVEIGRVGRQSERAVLDGIRLAGAEEAELLDPRDDVGCPGRVGDRDVVAIDGNGVVGDRAGQQDRIRAAAAVHLIGSGTAHEDVVAGAPA